MSLEDAMNEIREIREHDVWLEREEHIREVFRNGFSSNFDFSELPGLKAVKIFRSGSVYAEMDDGCSFYVGTVRTLERRMKDI